MSLCDKHGDPRVFGVIAAGIDQGLTVDSRNQLVSLADGSTGALAAQNDQRTQINSVGEGAIWVVEDAAGTPLSAGDLVTTSAVRGYAAKQADDILRACTAAKLTMDCDWAPRTVPVQVVRRDVFGTVVLDEATGRPLLEQAGSETETEYRLRHVRVSDGSLATEEEWKSQTDGSVRRAALLGCTYHCG